MVYDTQDYWVSGHCKSSGILNTRKRDDSEIYMFPSSSEVREKPTLLGPFERANLSGFSERLALPKRPNSVSVSFPSLEDGNRSRFRNVVFSGI
jgi:hypothetical protein